MSANNNLGTAGVALYADTAAFDSGLSKSAAVAEKEMRRIARESAMAERIVGELGRRMQLGAQVAEGSGAAFRRQSESTRQAGQQMVQGDRSARQMAQGMQALALQSNDVFVSLASGQNPLMVLIQQGAQVTQAFGGIGETVRGVGSLFTLTRVAALGLGAGVAYAAYQMYLGSEAAKAYERALVLNGNAAGVTEQSTRDLAASLQVSTGVTALAAREAVTAVASTGRVSGDALQQSARALIAYQRLSGATTEEALKLFDKQASGAAAWAADVNKSYNFLTAAEYRRIKAMEEAGDKLGALRETNAIFSRELEQRDTPQVGYIATAFKFWGRMIDEVKAKLQGLGAGSSLQDQLKAAEQALSDARGRAVNSLGAAGSTRNPDDLPAVQSARELVENLRARISLQEAGARASAELAQRNQAAIDEEIEKDKRRTDGKRALAEAERVYQELIRNAQRGTDAPRTIADFRQLEAGQYDDTNRALADRQAKEAEARRDAAQREAAAMERDKAEIERLFAESDIANRTRERERAERQSVEGFRAGAADAASRWWEEQNDQTKRGSELFVNSFRTMEDAVARWARTGKFEAEDFFGSMAETAIRELTRIAQQKLFFDSAGSFMGSGSLLGDAFTLAASVFGFANGIPYVPYDGMPAVLHEGERVLTKQENVMGSASASRGGGPVFDMSGGTTVVGQGVSMAQVHAVVNAGNARVEARIRRLMSERRF